MPAHKIIIASLIGILLVVPFMLIRAEAASVSRTDVAARIADRDTGDRDHGAPTPPSPPSPPSPPPPPPTPVPDTATITIRDGSTVAFSGPVSLAASTSPAVSISPTSSTSTIAVAADSLLATLVALDASTTSFDITDLQYFSSFNSFYINCIVIPAVQSSPLCADWQFVVNGVAPQVGADHVTLRSGDSAIFYFGFPRQVTLSTSTVAVNQKFTATAQAYDPASNTFSPAPGVTIGVTKNDPAHLFTPIVVASSTADALGQATFALSATGTYAVGITEDFFFPSTPLTVISTSSDATSTPPSGGNGGGGSGGTGGGGGSGPSPQFNIPNALAFIVSKQHTDGSFDSPVSTDWTAVAFAASDPGAAPSTTSTGSGQASSEQAKTKLRNYLLATTPSLSSATDYERHAMALMALGIDPYAGTPINYIAAIVSKFDGTQTGDASLDNDDIFALFPLLHAGFGPSDIIIQKEVAFLLSRQKPDGSWDESPDMTAAAIQALGPLLTTPSSAAALGKAAGYLASTEQADGGWGNIDSTSWVQIAINGIIEAHTPGFQTEEAWKNSAGHVPTDALASAQQSDGGVPSASDRVWSTSYAVVAASGKSWITILRSFSPPTAGGIVIGGGAGSSSSTSSATTTESAATSTPVTARTTPEVLGVSTSTAESGSAATSTTTPSVAAKKPLKKTKPQKPPENNPPVAEQATTAQPTLPASETFGTKVSHWFHQLGSFFVHLFFK